MNKAPNIKSFLSLFADIQNPENVACEKTLKETNHEILYPT
jgi:hypothetical protein